MRSSLYKRLSTLGSLAVVCHPAIARAESPDGSSSDAPHELEGIVVEGKLVPPPSSAPSTTSSVSEEELEKYEEDDVHQVLLKVPGVQIRGEDGVGLRPNIGIRGTSPNRSAKIVLMEDGVPLTPSPYSAPAAYYFPLITRMSRVDVHKGGSQLRFGPRALGGAVNLITAKIPKGWKGKADVALGEYDYLKAHGRGGYGAERTGFLLEAAHVESTGFKELDGGGDTGFGKNEMMAKWRVSSSPQAKMFQELELKFGFANERSNETYLGLTDADFEDTPYRRYAASAVDQMTWHRGQLQADYTVYPTDNLELKLTAYRHQFTRDWFKAEGFDDANIDDILANPTTGRHQLYYGLLTGALDTTSPEESLIMADNYRYYTSQGASVGLFYERDTGPVHHEVEGGLRLHADEVNRRHTLHRYQMLQASDEAFARPVKSDSPTTLAAHNMGSALALSAHVIDSMEMGQWTFSPGLRLEVVGTKFKDHEDSSRDNESTQIGLIPGAGLHYSATEDLGLLAGVYRGYGPTAPQAKSTDEPRAESSTTYEAGARYSSSRMHVEAIGFFNNYENLTANCSQAQGCASANVGEQFNGGRVFVYGLETQASAEPQWNQFSFPLRATYSWTDSSFRSDFLSTNAAWGDVEVGDELPYLPTHQLSVSAGIAQKDVFAFHASLTSVGSARESAGSGTPAAGEKTDAYTLLGLGAQGRAYGPLWIYAKAGNLLNETYLTSRRPHGARPGAPRWIQLGLKLQH